MAGECTNAAGANYFGMFGDGKVSAGEFSAKKLVMLDDTAPFTLNIAG